MILAGIVIMVGSDAFIGQLGGALLALMMTFSMASMIVIMRVKKSVSMLPASCLSAFLSSLVVWPIASEAIPTGTTMFHLVLFGGFPVRAGAHLADPWHAPHNGASIIVAPSAADCAWTVVGLVGICRGAARDDDCRRIDRPRSDRSGVAVRSGRCPLNVRHADLRGHPNRRGGHTN